jgi:ElaB/YqjD/DUF883 family membrane-anchored ribosome-binding protein
MTSISSRDRGTPGDPAQHLKGDVQRLRSDVGQVKDDLVTMARDAGEAAQHRLSAVTDTARERSIEAVDSLRHSIADRPLTSIGIAAGVGLLLGLCLRRT